MNHFDFQQQKAIAVTRLMERTSAGLPVAFNFHQPETANSVVIGPTRAGMSAFYRALLVRPKPTLRNPAQNRAQPGPAGGQMAIHIRSVAPPNRFTPIARAVDQVLRLRSEVVHPCDAIARRAGYGSWAEALASNVRYHYELADGFNSLVIWDPRADRGPGQLK